MRQNILGRVSTDLYVHLAPFQLLAHPLAVDGERGVWFRLSERPRIFSTRATAALKSLQTITLPRDAMRLSVSSSWGALADDRMSK